MKNQKKIRIPRYPLARNRGYLKKTGWMLKENLNKAVFGEGLMRITYWGFSASLNETSTWRPPSGESPS